MAAPYALLDRPDVLILRLGGGIGAFAALHHGARSATIVEPDPVLVHMLRDEPFFRSYTGDLLRDPRVRIVATEPRAFTAGTADRFDLVEIGLVDSVGLSQTGGNPVEENFLYTAEGIASYLSALKPGGMLSITVWNRLTPPRNVPKLLSTVAEALRIRGVDRPRISDIRVRPTPVDGDRPRQERSLRFERSARSEVLLFADVVHPLLLSRHAEARAELQRGSSLVRRAARSFDGRTIGGERGSARQRKRPPPGGSLLLHAGFDFLRPREIVLCDLSFLRAAGDRRQALLHGLCQAGRIPAVAADIRELSEEWGYLLLVATLGLSAIFGLVIVLVPMIGRRKELFARRKGTIRVIVYYACLGLGYMMIEIFLIQRLTFFLVDPIFSNSVVITAMLVLSGIGSLSSGTWRMPSRNRVLVAAGGIALSCLFYVFGLTPIVNALLGLPLAAKISIAILAIAPAAFCLGIPFPTGLSALSSSRPGLIPWAWGVNGAVSVTGTVLARLLSISAGYSIVLVAAVILYALAAANFSGNAARQTS